MFLPPKLFILAPPNLPKNLYSLLNSAETKFSPLNGVASPQALRFIDLKAGLGSLVSSWWLEAKLLLTHCVASLPISMASHKTALNTIEN